MICIAAASNGAGGIAGGEGAGGQPSLRASGASAGSYGYPVLEVSTGLTCSLEVQLTKDLGGTVQSDLAGISSVEFSVMPSMTCGEKTFTIICPFTADGVVTVPLTPLELDNRPGVWYAEFACKNSAGAILQAYRAYLVIRKGLNGSSSGVHPLTISEVRMALMDTSAEANQLIEDLEFSDIMIVNCIERAVNEWNEMPPTLAEIFDTTNFPYREALLKGTCAYLLQSMAYRYARNRMQHSAGGFTLDDNDKAPVYTQLAAALRSEWKAFINTKKTEHNINECYGSISMPYYEQGNNLWGL